MITAEQAWEITVSDRKLKEVENLIIRTAKSGEHKCELKLRFGEDYAYIKEKLEYNGFQVVWLDTSSMAIMW